MYILALDVRRAICNIGYVCQSVCSSSVRHTRKPRMSGLSYRNAFALHDTAMFLASWLEANFHGPKFSGSPRTSVLKRGIPVECANLTNNMQ